MAARAKAAEAKTAAACREAREAMTFSSALARTWRSQSTSGRRCLEADRPGLNRHSGESRNLTSSSISEKKRDSSFRWNDGCSTRRDRFQGECREKGAPIGGAPVCERADRLVAVRVAHRVGGIVAGIADGVGLVRGGGLHG